MSRSEFEMVSSILNIWKIIMQAAIFLVLWAAVFGIKKGKRDGIAAALFVLVNIGVGLLPCASWTRYAVLAFVAMGYSWMNYKKQIGKAIFVILAFYNFHSLSFLIASSIYMEITSMMMKELDVLQENYMQQMYQCMSVWLAASIFFYTALFVAMTVIVHRLIKGEAEMEWQDVILLSVLNFVGSMIAKVISELMTVRIDDEIFILFDEKPDLLWKMPLIAALIFAGEAALIFFLEEIPYPACRKAEAFCRGAAGQGHEETAGRGRELLRQYPQGKA